MTNKSMMTTEICPVCRYCFSMVHKGMRREFKCFNCGFGLCAIKGCNLGEVKPWRTVFGIDVLICLRCLNWLGNTGRIDSFWEWILVKILR